MAKKTPDHLTPEKLDWFEKAIETHPEIERKGATVPYTSHNGHMFSFFDKKDFVALRLPKDAREEFIEKHKTDLAVSHGTVMKEYVVVPDAVLNDIEQMKHYFEMSFEYIKTLKPKPTKKPKK